MIREDIFQEFPDLFGTKKVNGREINVEQTIAGVSGVLAVHDLHVWTIGSGIIACSCHITVGEQSIRSGQDVLRAVNEALEHGFGISHSTIQVEVEGCDPNDMYCIARAATHGRRA